MNVTLAVTAGPHAGKEFAFDRHDTFLVGRSKKAHFQLSADDPYFSREHFLVEVNPPRVRVTDLKSRNGICVNGTKVKTADLKDGDELTAGHTVFKIRVSAPDPDQQETFALPAEPSAPALGTTTVSHALGPVIAECELGRGAMGVVYRAKRDADGRPVALKVIAPAAGVGEKSVQRFLREARILAGLNHRNIVHHLDSGDVGGSVYLAMELVDGPDARQVLRERGPLEPRMAVRVVLQVLDGLGHAHDSGYVHRDIKPAYILLGRDGTKRVAKVADFGLARAFEACNMSGLTMQGEVGGTPAFMPPEQVTHYRHAKPAADQYAAAATLYYLLCGRYPLDFEPDRAAQLVQIVTDERVPLRERRADVPAGLEAAIMKALSREPEKRHRDVAALREAIRAWA